MKTIFTQFTFGVICLILGIILVVQLRGWQNAPDNGAQADTNQASYISKLYDSTSDLRGQVSTLQTELDRYTKDSANDKSSLNALSDDLQNLRIANGDADVRGPGVNMLVDGTVTVTEVQDLVNELRNASAEAISVNGVRVVTRSAITVGQDGNVTIDSQPITRPYTMEAIGDPDTLVPALQRKGGLVALLKAGDPNLTIEITRHNADNSADWLTLPKTALSFNWTYAQPGDGSAWVLP